MYEYYENYGHKIASAADELLMKLPETPEPKNVPAKNNDIKPADEPSEPKKRDEKPANEPQFDISYLSDEEAAVYNTIKNSGTAMLADDIAEACGIDIADMLSILTDLEIEGAVTQKAGQSYTAN